MKSLKLSKQNVKGIVLVAVILAILLAIVIGFVRMLVIQQGQMMRQNEQIENLEQEIKAEQDRLEALEQEKSQVATDEYIEGVARDKLGMTDPDEKVFVDVSGK